MKKSIFTLLILFITSWSLAQVVTTNPTFVTQNGGSINVTFDATLGNASLKDYAGTDGIYAHTGVITNASATSSDWKHAPTWGDNSAKYKLTSLGNNKWVLAITPDMTTYYGLTTGEIVTKMAFVFRNGASTKEGKNTGGTDIFVDVFQSGLNVAFTNPTANQNAALGTVMNIQFGASAPSNLNLLMNGTSVQTAPSASSLSYSYTFVTAGNYIFIAQASLNGVLVADTIQVFVPEAVTNQARPAGVKDGINYINNTTATLVMYAPGKTNAFLIGDFNNWTQLNSYQLRKDGDYWWYTLTGLTPGQLYGFQYLVDGTLKVSDPYTEMVLDPSNDKYINTTSTVFPNLKPYPVGKTDGLVATLETAKPAYSWEIPAFTMPPAKNMVIYELLLRDFTTEKTLAAAITRLDYLKNLGITAVELMPVQEFDGNLSWGYNPNHYFAPDKAYGNEDMYKKFIDECHKRGMAVLLDMVFNQATGQCPFAMLYWDAVNSRPAANNPWMNPVAPHQYSVFNDFNHSFTGTTEYFKRVLQFWITEYKVDGYRMDLTKGFTQNSGTESTYDQSRIDNISTYFDAVKAVKSDAIFILEHFCINTEETVLANKGMYLWRNTLSTVNDITYNSYSQSAMGIQSNSDFGAMNTTPRNWVGYAESHDEERNFYTAKISGLGNITTDSIVRVNRVPLNIAFTTLIPGPKMIYEFGEMGYDYSINSLGGRTNEKPSAWGWLNLPHRKAASDACAKIMSLRKMYPTAFTQGTFDLNIAVADWNTGRRIALTHTDLSMVVLGNFNASASITATPNFQKTGVWYNLLTGAQLNVTNTSMTITMQPGELLIYTDRVISFPNGLSDPIVQNSTKIFPTETTNFIYITTPYTVDNVNIYSLQGTLVGAVANSTTINVTNLRKGVYILEVNTFQGKSIHKIIKE